MLLDAPKRMHESHMEKRLHVGAQLLPERQIALLLEILSVLARFTPGLVGDAVCPGSGLALNTTL
jgi:hypothetical protein